MAVPDDTKARSVGDWSEEFKHLLKKAEADNINNLHYKYVKIHDEMVESGGKSEHVKGYYTRNLVLSVLFTDDEVEALNDASHGIIEDLIKEIEVLGGGANLLVHPSQAIRDLYSSYIKKA
jgi:hypothetical protein